VIVIVIVIEMKKRVNDVARYSSSGRSGLEVMKRVRGRLGVLMEMSWYLSVDVY